MGSFKLQQDGGATYFRKTAKQNLELKKNIARYEKDLSQALGKIRSSQQELRRSMVAYTQHARSLRSNETEATSHISRVSLQNADKKNSKISLGKLPALGRPLPKPLPPGDPLLGDDLLERSHTIPPVRKSADIRGRRRSQDAGQASNKLNALQHRPISRPDKLWPHQENAKKLNKDANPGISNGSVTLVAWDELDQKTDDPQSAETASTTAVVGDVTDAEIDSHRQKEAKRLLHEAIKELKVMEHKLKLPPIKHKSRLSLSNSFATIQESEEIFDDITRSPHDSANLRAVPVRRRRTNHKPHVQPIQENESFADHGRQGALGGQGEETSESRSSNSESGARKEKSGLRPKHKLSHKHSKQIRFLKE